MRFGTRMLGILKKKKFFSSKTSSRKKWQSRAKLISNKFWVLLDATILNLEAPFTVEEIKMVAWACGGDKALGADGFTIQFNKHEWEILKNDVYSYVKHFERWEKFANGCNSSFITMVPKVQDPLTLTDFRLISLIGCMYKIIAKILAIRLKGVVGSNIEELQTAFVEGRNIFDDPLIVNEICSCSKKIKKENSTL